MNASSDYADSALGLPDRGAEIRRYVFTAPGHEAALHRRLLRSLSRQMRMAQVGGEARFDGGLFPAIEGRTNEIPPDG